MNPFNCFENCLSLYTIGTDIVPKLAKQAPVEALFSGATAFVEQKVCFGWLVVYLFSVISWLVGCVVCSWVGWLVPTVELPTAVDFTGEPALIRQRTADFLFFSTLCFSFQCFSSFVLVLFVYRIITFEGRNLIEMSKCSVLQYWF